MPAKNLETPLLIFPCFAISTSPPQNNVVLWSKIGMTGRFCDSAFQINIVTGVVGYLNLMAIVRNADYEGMAEVFQRLLAGIIAVNSLAA